MTEHVPSGNDRSDLPRSIGRPATAALQLAGITRLEEVAERNERDLLQLHGVGPKAIRLLRQERDAHGLSFAEAADRH